MDPRTLLRQIRAAGLSVTVDAGRLVVRPGSLLTDDLRRLIADHKSGLNSLLGGSPSSASDPFVPWSDADGHAFLDRVNALRRYGMQQDDAERLADVLRLRRVRGDDRTVCVVDCGNYSAGRCRSSARAGVSQQLGDLAIQLQRCPGFVPLRAA